MSITIALSDADNDGTGIDFLDYLSDYDANFSNSGWGGFNDPSAGPYSGTEYAISNSGATTSVVMGAATGNTLDYDFGNHVLAGSLDSVSFGEGLSLNTTTDSYEQTAVDIDITGLGLTGTGANNDVHTVVYDLMLGNDDELLSQFDSGVTYISSSGDDVMTGFTGNDTFVFNDGSGDDVVDDFDSGSDLLDVSGWGAEEFGDLTISEYLGTSYVGDGTGDLIIVTSVTGLDAADFIFA